MPLVQVNVVPPATASIPDGTVVAALGGRQGEAIYSPLHGKYYAQAVRGNVHYASTAASGSAFSIFSNATYVGLGIWNPEGSGKNISLIRCNVGIDTQSSTAASGWGYAWINNTGSSLATLGVISAFTLITATRGTAICGLGGQNNSVARVCSGATLTAALLWGRAASFGTSTGAITTQLAPPMLTEDFDGMMIVPPNCFFALTSSILSGAPSVATLIWEECPV